MMRVFIVLAVMMGTLGIVAAATHPAISHQASGKPNWDGNGSLFAGIGL